MCRRQAERDNLLGNQGTAGDSESGRWPRYTTPPRRGWHSLHLRGVIKTSARVGEGKIKFDKKRKERSEETLLVCECGFSAIRPHAFTEPVFFLFSLIT